MQNVIEAAIEIVLCNQTVCDVTRSTSTFVLSN